MKDLKDQTAFVTGGASGIGLATARALARRGARLILADIVSDKVEAAAAELRAAAADAIGLTLNVAEQGEWARAGEQARAFGEVSVLVSNAGVGGGSGTFETYDPEVWRWAYAVNAHAHLYACRTFLGAMKASGRPGHLTLTSSMVAIVPPPVSVAYISSKFATLGIAMALRNELADTQVGISVLCPGMSPEKIGERLACAIEAGEFFVFTHPEWKGMAEAQFAEVLAAFGESADPSYKGDDIAGLVAANGAKRMNVAAG